MGYGHHILEKHYAMLVIIEFGLGSLFSFLMTIMLCFL